MREVECALIKETVAHLCREANTDLGADIKQFLVKALEEEVSPTGRVILEQILENAMIASQQELPLCQDTGTAVIFVDLGQEVRLVGGTLEEALAAGVRQGYREGYLRKSLVWHPLRRENTGDNTPPVVHLRLVPGNQVGLTVAPKGGGSENMSRIAMLAPAAGQQGVVEFVVDTVRQAGGNPCPPLVVGVGLGGNFETAPLLAKRALLRPLGQAAVHPQDAAIEQEILAAVNDLGIGPQGLGGRVTALAVHLETAPCHIASLPVAVNINCHSARHRSTVI